MKALLKRMNNSRVVWETLRTMATLALMAGTVRLIIMGGDTPLRWEPALILIAMILSFVVIVWSGEALRRIEFGRKWGRGL